MIPTTKRERLLAAGLLVAVGAWGLYTLGIRPATDRIRTLRRIIPETQAQLRTLQGKSAQYRDLQSELAQARAKITAQDPNFEVTGFLETMLDRHKLTEHVVTMGPDPLPLQTDYAPTVVTIDLREISWKQLIDFLIAVETSKSIVRVSRLHIQEDAKNEALLDSTVGICSPRLGPPAVAAQAAR